MRRFAAREWKNLADNPEYAAIKKKMRKEIPAHHEPPGVTYVPPKPSVRANRQQKKN
jgi:hypothetical protein